MTKKIMLYLKKLIDMDSQQMKNLTAIHEAAHTVTAYLSKYHFLTKVIALTSDQSGETFVTLSKKKLAKLQKPLIAETSKDPDIVKDAATIYYSGFEAEKIFSEKNSIATDISFSKNDYEHIEFLIQESNDITIDKLELQKESFIIVNSNWSAICQIAEQLLSASGNSVDAVHIIEILDKCYGNNSWE
jgi:hypothetical protein